MTGRDGKIVTFYSYKGGTGRTMALANVAWILASSGKRVLAVDWREKPGAVGAFLKSHDAGSLPTLVDDTGAVMRGVKAYGLPMTVLIDPKGNIVARAAGPADWGTPEAVAYFKRVTGT